MQEHHVQKYRSTTHCFLLKKYVSARVHALNTLDDFITVCNNGV